MKWVLAVAIVFSFGCWEKLTGPPQAPAISISCPIGFRPAPDMLGVDHCVPDEVSVPLPGSE